MIRLLRAHLRSESGAAALYLLAVIAGLILDSFALGLRYGWNSTSGKQIRDCVTQVTVAKAAIQTILAGHPDGTVAFDDPNAVVIERCRALVNQLKNDPTFSSNAGALGKLVNSSLSSIDQCQLREPVPTADPTVAIAGRDLPIPVNATIPVGSFSTDFAAQASLSGGGVGAVAVGLTKLTGSDGLITWHGTLTIPGANSRSVADGAKSAVVVTAAGTAIDTGNTPITPLPDGTCPFGLARAGNVCRITCTLSHDAVTWKVIPEITVDFGAATDGITTTLSWTVKNSTTRLLKGPNFSSSVPETGSWPVKRGPTDQTWTLTASAPDTATVVKMATVPKTVPATGFAVAITSPGNLSLVTSDSVTVTGTVSPLPSPGDAQITVNGSGVSVPIDNTGHFSGTVPLQKKTSQSHLVLTNPGNDVTFCGNTSTIPRVTNIAAPDDVRNVITVTAGGSSSSVTVFHAVRLEGFDVTWLSCPPFDKNEPLGITLGPGAGANVGSVDCGCNNAPDGCHAACRVRLLVFTFPSVGILSADATWTFNVPGPCP